MQHFDKTILALAFTLAASSTPSSAQTLVAGWDTWDAAAAPTATRLASDVTATAVAAVDVHPDPLTPELNRPWRTNDGRGASTDGDWGSIATDPAASIVGGDGVSNECLELGNATTGGTLTFSISNNGATDIVLGSFNFDSYAFRPKAARTYELSVLEGGGITAGVVYTSTDLEIPQVTGAWDNMAHADIDHSLTELADHTLAPGESVDFLLAFSGGIGDGGGGHDLWVDNVAVFTGTAELPSITDVRITKSDTDLTLTFTSSGIVDIYRSTDLQTWQLWAEGEESPYLDVISDDEVIFYTLVPTGEAFP